MAYIVSHACLLGHPELARKHRLTPSLDCVIFFAYA
jgi:AhpD family alkylhydroperoxidase